MNSKKSGDDLLEKKKLVIIGGGGHAKVLIDIALESNDYDVIGYTSHMKTNEKIMDVPYIGGDDIFGSLDKDTHRFIVAVGNNNLRRKLYLKITAMGYEAINLISSKSIVSRYAFLGNGIVVMPGAVINAAARINNNVIINTSSIVEHDCVIESHAHIAPGTVLTGNVHVDEGAFIGAGSTIIPQINVGKWATVGAGSTVISDITEYCTVVGVPAKRYIKKDGEHNGSNE